MTMPAGRYYIGDLCYVMTDEEWDEFCSITIKGNQCIDGEFTFKDGRRFATYGTKWGDGLYFDQYGREYSVDAGLIGCIKIDDIKAEKYDNIEDLGNVTDWGVDFITNGGRGDPDWDGVIRFGNCMIRTDGDD
jgi:hypothetical protein